MGMRKSAYQDKTEPVQQGNDPERDQFTYYEVVFANGCYIDLFNGTHLLLLTRFNDARNMLTR
jgi:hypothetical protein